jgi:NAD(P)-dependent dehydrogenase (short-subunit alcohol dehydrogenase family)
MAVPPTTAREEGLLGRTVMVFGAGSSGARMSNGEAAVLAYARAGAAVACVDIDHAEADRVAAEVRALGGTALPIVADVTREDAVEDAVRQCLDGLGVPHVLHNNVGVAAKGSVTELDLRAWERAVRINLTSAYLTCHHVLPHMLGAGRGVITNVSSLASIRETGYVYPAYSASKAALNQLTVSIALSYARHGIRANALLPGLIDTPLVSNQISQDERHIAERHAMSPTGRMGRPEDVADAAVFLASDRASYINGVCLPVDGGLSARIG